MRSLIQLVVWQIANVLSAPCYYQVRDPSDLCERPQQRQTAVNSPITALIRNFGEF